MSIKSIVSLFNQMKSEDFSEEAFQRFEASMSPIEKELEACTQDAQSVILSRMSEKDLVVLMLMVQKVIAAKTVELGDFSIVKADLGGELQSYTQTVILATIGLLINEEVL